MTSDTYAALWYQALEVEIGIGIETEDVKLLRRDLYRAREMLGDPSLDEVIMITPPSGKEVWLCKKRTNLSEK